MSFGFEILRYDGRGRDGLEIGGGGGQRGDVKERRRRKWVEVYRRSGGLLLERARIAISRKVKQIFRDLNEVI